MEEKQAASSLELSRRSAQAMVEEVGAIVRQNINMMDREGRVIASTDPSRIGSIHEIARQMVAEGIPELYVEEDQEARNVKAGLNLSLEHQGRTVGVIGITGPYEEVAGYGQVVKKMVEILMRENVLQDEQRMRQRVLSRFLEDWVMGTGLLKPQDLKERGFRLGIDISLPRRIMVVSPANMEEYASTPGGQKILSLAEQAASRAVPPKSLLLPSGGRLIVLCPYCPEEGMVRAAVKILQAVKKETGVQAAAGIDGGAREIHLAYAQADKSWRAACAAGKQLVAYRQVTLELFTEDIPDNVKQEYLQKVFAGCSQEELRGWMELLEAYFGQEGSLAKTSQVLHIHKNTLTYRLRKLSELTGYDVRLPSQSAVFYMAMVFFKDVGRLFE